MENIDLIKQYIQSLNQAVTTLDPQIITLTSESFEDRINSESDPLKRVKIATNYAYTIVTLAFAYLKSIGVDTAKHPIMEDLNRVKSYMKRYKDASSGVDEEEQKRIDNEKAKRFINAALGNNQQSNLNTTTSGMAQPAISTHTKFAADDEKKEDKNEEEEETKTKSEAKQIRNEFKSDKLQKISKAGNATGKNLKKGKFTSKSNKK